MELEQLAEVFKPDKNLVITLKRYRLSESSGAPGTLSLNVTATFLGKISASIDYFCFQRNRYLSTLIDMSDASELEEPIRIDPKQVKKTGGHVSEAILGEPFDVYVTYSSIDIIVEDTRFSIPIAIQAEIIEDNLEIDQETVLES